MQLSLAISPESHLRCPTPEEDYDEAADRQVSLGLVFESLDGLMFRGLGQVRLGSSHRSCPLCFWL